MIQSPVRQKPHVALRAHCACGAVQVRVDGPILAMFMCACEECQKATGTGHATVALAAPSSIGISGATKSFSRPAASGALFTRWFCPECATHLYACSNRAPDAVLLPVGLFGGQTEWYVPSQLIFARSHRKWDWLPAGLARHQTYRGEQR